MKNIAFLFAGQGAQSVGMGKDLYDANPTARAVFDMGEALRPGTEALCFSGESAALNRTENTQPCLFLTDLAIARALAAAGVTPDAVAGFSLGEIPAAAFAGMFSYEDAFRLVTLRGERMGACSARHPGGMVAVLKLDRATVDALCDKYPEVWAVNYNCPGQIACAGNADVLDAFAEDVKNAGGRAVRLAVSGAFHTPYMQDVVADLQTFMDNHAPVTPKIPLYANRTGVPYPTDRAGMTDTLSHQVCSPVRWEDTLRAMWEAGIRTFVEVGAGATLTGLVRRTLPEATMFTVNDLASLEKTADALTTEV